MAGGYGIGLANDWGFIMTGALLVFNDLQKDFRRLEERSAEVETKAPANGSAQSSGVDGASETRARKVDGGRKSQQSTHAASGSHGEGYVLRWQSYPTSIGHCTDWLLDLVTGFRGVNWSFRPALFPPIEGIPAAFPGNKQSASSNTIRVQPTIEKVHQQAIRSFIFLYLSVDLAKTLVIHDPYYLGLAALDSPHPLWLLQPYPFLTRIVRLGTSLYSIIAALSFIVSFFPRKHLPPN